METLQIHEMLKYTMSDIHIKIHRKRVWIFIISTFKNKMSIEKNGILKVPNGTVRIASKETDSRASIWSSSSEFIIILWNYRASLHYSG